MKMLKQFIFLSILSCIVGSPTPIVLWHGMGDTCCFSFSLGSFKLYLEKAIPGVYVESIRVGNSTLEDYENGYFMSPNKQVAEVCDQLGRIPQLKDGFNAIGFSQGSQFLRGLVQRCGHLKVKNLITLGGQHQGVYGLPYCKAKNHKGCDYIRKLLNYAAYEEWLQQTLVQATYWHDPLNEEKYKEHSLYLSDINNERKINQTYITNLNNLEHFIMVKFGLDTMVQPKESEWFGFYKPGQSQVLQTLQQSDLYLQDRLGLRSMDQSGKLVFLSFPGDHLRFTQGWFEDNILNTYLK